MQKIILYTIVIVFSFLTKAVAQELETIEKSTEWMARGTKPESYEMGLSKKEIMLEKEKVAQLDSYKLKALPTEWNTKLFYNNLVSNY